MLIQDSLVPDGPLHAGGLLPTEPGSGRGRSHGTSNSKAFDRWFRYPAGFASDYVSTLLETLSLSSGSLIVDPFAGSAVTGTAARRAGHSFSGIETHPLIAELANLKLQVPPSSPESFAVMIGELAKTAEQLAPSAAAGLETEADLTQRCFQPDVLARLVSLRDLIRAGQADEWGVYAKWALLGTLRDVASARVGWPYQRPGTQRQPRFTDPLGRFVQRATWMAEDLQNVRANGPGLYASVTRGDSRDPEAWGNVEGAHGCVASPPYLNNFDYADATRLELYFWGEVTSWAQMCSAVRSGMITATTQQSSVAAAREASSKLARFGNAGTAVEELTAQLAAQRNERNRGKEYDRVIPDYFAAMAQILENLAKSMLPGASAVWLVGDSAPYGVYVDTPGLIGQIAEYVGFSMEKDVVLRRRGQRWASNQTRHDVELSERLILLRRQ
ncbi:DNA methyltransferase [Streptomyces sp. NPDC008139]|uniref:DNA methyltransferase n=1 Tax=Streptomyces sp. NPDC008139 TaxID=3364814 RepID=UPI0036E309F0